MFSNIELISDRLPLKFMQLAYVSYSMGSIRLEGISGHRRVFFCDQQETVDSMEHITNCEAVLRCLPRKYLSDRTLPLNRLFFFLTRNNDYTLTLAMFRYAIYSVHNQIIHTGITRELKGQINRAMRESTLGGKERSLWNHFIVFISRNPGSRATGVGWNLWLNDWTPN